MSRVSVCRPGLCHSCYTPALGLGSTRSISAFRAVQRDLPGARTLLPGSAVQADEDAARSNGHDTRGMGISQEATVVDDVVPAQLIGGESARATGWTTSGSHASGRSGIVR